MASLKTEILNALGINPALNNNNANKDIYNSNIVHQKVSQNTGGTTGTQTTTGMKPVNSVSTQGAAMTGQQTVYPTYLKDDSNGNTITAPTAATAGTTNNNLYGAAVGALGLGGSVGASKTGSSGGSGGSAANPNQQYIDQLNSLYNQILNRGTFSYDLQGDPLYRQYADQYTQLGQQAMRDTQAQSAALTGGYGNSYASSAGSQAYQQYLNQLNSVIPELYDRAYQAWQNEGDDLLTQYNLIASHPSNISAMTPKTSSGGGSSKKNSNSYNISDFEDLLDQIILNSQEEDAEAAADEASYSQWKNFFTGGTTAVRTSSSNYSQLGTLRKQLRNNLATKK